MELKAPKSKPMVPANINLQRRGDNAVKSMVKKGKRFGFNL